jgi:Tol biopolymer transport system component
MNLTLAPILRWLSVCLSLAGLLSSSLGHAQATMPLGIFQGQSDIGTVLHPGSAKYDAGRGTYTISGNGANMWFGTDDFHYVWTKVSGDVALTADIDFVGVTGNAHRKAALMLRQSLDPHSVYVDAARHGDGLTSLQYRDATNVDTHEIETTANGPHRLRIEKRGNYAYVFIPDASGRMVPSGAAMHVDLNGAFYVGLGVCSHDKDVTETAIFSNVKIEPLAPTTTRPVLYSTLETVIVASTDRRVRYVAPMHFEAPNWTRDGTALIFTQDGTMHRWRLDNGIHPIDSTLPLATAPTLIPTAPETACNNDHGLSFDGTQLAISDRGTDGKSRIYIVPSTGGTPRQITPDGPSYWHGWSPDGKTIAFTGERAGEFDIYTIPVTGGPETRLTTAPGLDDGPEYSPDGKWIYFNSVRTGHMQIWRMHPDGSQQEQVLTDERNDWFPHISPDGKLMVWVSFLPGVEGHPANREGVEVRMMALAEKKVKTLAKLFGGQGTLNVPSWSPDSRMVAFVSYEMLPPQ